MTENQTIINARTYWYQLPLNVWHFVSDIPGTTFWTIWNSYIEKSNCEIDGDMFRRVDNIKKYKET